MRFFHHCFGGVLLSAMAIGVAVWATYVIVRSWLSA